MARPRKTGIKVAYKTLHDGTRRAYYYDRATGRPLSIDDRDAAIGRASTASAPKLAAAPGTFAALIEDYRRSPGFTEKAPHTRKDYLSYLELIRSELGDMPVSGFRPRHVAMLQEKYRDRPRKANFLVAVLRIILNLAVKRELIAANPAAQPDMLPTRARTQLWSRDDQTDFLAAADPRLHLAFLLLLYTTQRVSDVLAMTKGQVYERDGRLMIELRQQKTGALIAVPTHRDLVPLLQARLEDKTGGMLLVPSPTGRPWAFRNFARKWDAAIRRMALRRARALFKQGWPKEKVRTELAAQHRQRRDLRRTGIVRMAEAGVTTPQIAAISGHAIDYCQRIIDTYLPRRTEVAIAAMTAWEAGEDAGRATARVVRLADRVPRR